MNPLMEMSIWKKSDRKEKVKRAYLSRDVADLELSVRSYNCLRRAGCETVGDVLRLVGEDGQGLRKVRNLGTRSEREILDKIEELRMNYEALPEEEITEEEHVQKLVKPARKVWDKEIRAFPISDHSVIQLKECGIETIGDLYKKKLVSEPGWYAVRELFDCIAW